jgi:hypothetical protein
VPLSIVVAVAANVLFTIRLPKTASIAADISVASSLLSIGNATIVVAVPLIGLLLFAKVNVATDVLIRTAMIVKIAFMI